MAVQRITVRRSEEVASRLRLYGKQLSTWRSLWRTIAGRVAAAERRWFATRGGGTWPELSEDYAAWKARHYPGRPLLVQKGDLRRAATMATRLMHEAAPGEMVLRIDDPKAGFHAPGHAGPVPDRDPLIPTEQIRLIAREALRAHVRFRAGIPGPAPMRLFPGPNA